MVLLPLVVLFAAGRSPMGLRSPLKMTEPRILLPCLDVRLEVLLAILTPLRWVTALPRPGPSGWTLLSSAGADRYRSGVGGCLSPSPSGMADSDRSSAFDAVDLDRDDFPVCPGPHPELPQHGRAGGCTISLMQDFSCIDLWVDVGDLSGIPPAYLSPDAVTSGRH